MASPYEKLNKAREKYARAFPDKQKDCFVFFPEWIFEAGYLERRARNLILGAIRRGTPLTAEEVHRKFSGRDRPDLAGKQQAYSESAFAVCLGILILVAVNFHAILLREIPITLGPQALSCVMVAVILIAIGHLRCLLSDPDDVFHLWWFYTEIGICSLLATGILAIVVRQISDLANHRENAIYAIVHQMVGVSWEETLKTAATIPYGAFMLAVIAIGVPLMALNGFSTLLIFAGGILMLLFTGWLPGSATPEMLRLIGRPGFVADSSALAVRLGDTYMGLLQTDRSVSESLSLAGLWGGLALIALGSFLMARNNR